MRPSPTPGSADFDAVAPGALKRTRSFPPTGTGSYARSCAPVPPAFGDQTAQSSAVPDVRPSEVTTPALDEKPHGSVLEPARARLGLPRASTPARYARR